MTHFSGSHKFGLVLTEEMRPSCSCSTLFDEVSSLMKSLVLYSCGVEYPATAAAWGFVGRRCRRAYFRKGWHDAVACWHDGLGGSRVGDQLRRCHTSLCEERYSQGELKSGVGLKRTIRSQ